MSTVRVDTVSEYTSANGITIDGVVVKDTTIDLNGTADAVILDADGDTTISSPTDDQIDIEIAGADDFTFTANTFTAASGSVIALDDGSAGSPALTNTGDTNCGLYFSAADTLSFTAAGTAQFTMADGVVAPVTDNDVDLGTSSLEFKDGYFDGTLYCDTLNLAGTSHTSIAAPWTHIKTITASNDSAVSFIDGTASVVVDSTYPTYVIIIRNLTPATDTQDLFFRYAQGGSIITTSKYSFHTDGGGSNVAAGTGNSNADNQDRMSLNGQDMQALDNDAASSFDMTMIISNPSGSTTRTNCYWHCSYNSETNATVHGRSGHGSYVNDSTAVDGFSFYMQSGNITIGTFSLYGISN